MFVVESLGLAIFLCIVTMMGWGSWANTQKLAGKEDWPFELYYWDYAIGVFLTGIVFALTLGSFGESGMGAVANLGQAAGGQIGDALLSGALFNLSNILLVVAIDAAGMSLAFPVGVGLALVIGTLRSYLQEPKGEPTLIFAGVALIVVAMIMSALAYSKLPPVAGRRLGRGLVFAVIAGCLMGSFLPDANPGCLAGVWLGCDPARLPDALHCLALFRARPPAEQLHREHGLHEGGRGEPTRGTFAEARSSIPWESSED